MFLSKGKRMAKKKEDAKLSIDGVEYSFDEISENAKAQIANIQFVDVRLQQLNNEWAVADTARMAYTNVFKREFDRTSE